MGMAPARGVTTDHRVLNRATWSARRGRRMRREWRITLLGPAGAPIVLGADDTVERRGGRTITATGCCRAAVRSTTKPVVPGVGLTGVSMRRRVPVPWARRVWARPCRTALCRPVPKKAQRRHKSRVEWVRPRRKHVRRGRPGRRRVLVVDGGVAAVSLARACGTHQVGMVSRWRWDAARSHRPGPQPPGQRGPTPLQGRRQRGVQTWAARADTPWETVEIDWDGGQRTQRWIFSHTAMWHTPGLPPVDIRVVLVCDPTGT